MERQYTAINLCAGMGIMSLAFEQAGFKVICNLVRDPKEKRILSENLGVSTQYRYEAVPESLPDADVMIGSFVGIQRFSTAQEGTHELIRKSEEAFLQATLKYMKPKAIFFEVGVQIQRTDMFRNMKDWFEKEGYSLRYCEIDMRRVTGSPIHQRRGYAAGLRRDIHAEFRFPVSPSPFLTFDYFQEMDVDHRYNVKNERIISECKDNGLYVWKSGKYQRSDEVNGVFRIPVLKSEQQLRWITPRELARIKGIPDHYKLSDKNRKWLYQEIWLEPHMKLMSLFAKELHGILGENVHITGGSNEAEQIPAETAHDMREGETHMVERRFDVFVSSTYDDLKDERKEVTQAVLECDCVPVGMEMFPASNLEQWRFIKKVIDKSDIYLVIIAGKYGSTGKDDLGRETGYTEMEFEYALRQGKPVLAFLVSDIGKLERYKTESDNDKMELLLKFRDKVKTGRLVKFYQNKDDLKAKVMGSLNQIKKQINSGGWVRADGSHDFGIEELKSNIGRLEAEKEKLQKQIDVFLEKEKQDRLKHEAMSAKLEDMCKNIELFEGQMKTFKLYLDTVNE